MSQHLDKLYSGTHNATRCGMMRKGATASAWIFTKGENRRTHKKNAYRPCETGSGVTVFRPLAANSGEAVRTKRRITIGETPIAGKADEKR